ncbi:permease [Halanaerobaculum tunisiense]
MTLKKAVKENKVIVVSFLAYLGTFLYNKNIFNKALGNTITYLKEMLEVMPAVMIISALISVWVPQRVILDNFGKDSGLKGRLISILIGSLSAGPIYAAFPITQSLMLKGASVTNVVIIISAWAVVKVPMLIVETKFLGLPFAATRYLLTVPAIIVMSIIIEKIISRSEILSAVDIDRQEKELIIEVEKVLPGLNCGSCDYTSCSKYAEAIVEGEADKTRSVPADDDIAQEIEMILKAY